VADEFHELIRRAHRTRRALARVILEDCLERLPHYRNLPDSLLAEVQRSILHHLGLLYRVTLETGRPLSFEDLEVSRRTARTRAGQGLPLGEFLTFFLVGLTRAWDHLIAQVGDDRLLRDQLLERVSAVISNQTQLMTTLTEVYVEERERLSRFREQDLDDFVQLLLAEETMQGVLDTRARTLGIALDEPHAIAIFGPTPPIGTEGAIVAPDDIRRRLAARLLGADVWVGRSRDGIVAVLPETPEPKALAATAEELLGVDGRVGVGSPGRDADGLRRSAREAQCALRIGLTLRGPETVHDYADVALLDLIGIGTTRAEEFMRAALGPLAAPDASETDLETLRQLAANNYSVKQAAAGLSVHPHTVSYRVRRLRSRFGLDLEDPGVRLRLQLALLILDATGRASDFDGFAGRNE
jgi:sugar diacid utilization regulator